MEGLSLRARTKGENGRDRRERRNTGESRELEKVSVNEYRRTSENAE
jgi:hypothetical protein